MDYERFDDLTRALATGTSRRRVLRGLVGSALGGALSLVGLEAMAANCRLIGQRCNDAHSCCKGAICTAKGVCRCNKDRGFLSCNGDGTTCVNTNNSEEHCGACNSPCGANEVCQGGQCVCASGFHRCSGTCVTDTDPTACGTSCTVCGTSQLCDANTGGCCAPQGFTSTSACITDDDCCSDSKCAAFMGISRCRPKDCVESGQSCGTDPLGCPTACCSFTSSGTTCT